MGCPAGNFKEYSTETVEEVISDATEEVVEETTEEEVVAGDGVEETVAEV